MLNRLKEFTEARGLTGYRFIKETGVAPNTAYRMIKDPKALPSIHVLEAICKRYNVQPSEIIYRPEANSAIV
jgi:transcriptional regulator with XRE-family HTH domain